MASDFIPDGSRLLTFQVSGVHSDEEFDALVDRASDAVYSNEDVMRFGPAIGSSSADHAIDVIYTPAADTSGACRAAKHAIIDALSGVVRIDGDVDVKPATPVGQLVA